MLVQFLRDVVIAVALLTALIAISLRPAQESDPALRTPPAMDKRIGSPPAVADADSLAMPPGVTSAVPQQ